MKKILAVTVVALALAPLNALAQERVGDAVLGGLSGAIVLGPIGAAAGAVVGYVAGPAIARSWGLGRSHAPQGRRTAHTPRSRNRTAMATSQTLLPPSRPIQAVESQEKTQPTDANSSTVTGNAAPATTAILAPSATGKSIPAPVASRRKAVAASQIAAFAPPQSASEVPSAPSPNALSAAASTPIDAPRSATPFVPVATVE